MKKTIIIILCVCACSIASAQTILDSMAYVRVNQDTLITRLLEEKVTGQMRQETEIDGYRVQVYSSNRQQTAKAEALELEKTLSEQLDVKVYVQYMPPFWKVRIGDFRSYEEAQTFKAELLERFPTVQGDTYVVRDKVQVIQ